MGSVNKVILIGHLGRDPEKKYTTGQTPKAIVKFSLATNESYNDRDGNRVERTEWHRVVVFGRPGEACADYLSKGRQVYVEGKLKTRSWDGDDGKKRYMTEVEVGPDGRVVFIGGRGQGGGDFSNDAGHSDGGFTDDDIPF